MLRSVFQWFLLAVIWMTFLPEFAVIGHYPKPLALGSQIELTKEGDRVKVVRAKESYSTLSLEGSDLHPEPPVPGGKEDTPDYVSELLQLQWRPNDPIDLYVIRPRNVKKPPVVLYLYSFPSDTNRFKNPAYCKRLVHSGAAAVGFVSALTGHRIGNHPLKQWFISELQESLATSVHDVQMILNYLDERGDLDMGRVGIFGQGSGGAIAILAAAADPRLRALDLLNPWGDWPDWLATSPLIPKEERASYIQPDFLKALKPLEPLRYLSALKSPSIRVQSCGDENQETKDAAAKLESALPATAKLVHYSTGRAMYTVSSDGRLFEWISTTLKSLPEPKQAKVTAPPPISVR